MPHVSLPSSQAETVADGSDHPSIRTKSAGLFPDANYPGPGSRLECVAPEFSSFPRSAWQWRVLGGSLVLSEWSFSFNFICSGS